MNRKIIGCYKIFQQLSEGDKAMMHESGQISAHWLAARAIAILLLIALIVEGRVYSAEFETSGLVFRTIEKGEHSGHTEGWNYVVRDAYSWEKLWNKVHSASPRKSSLPKIDFTENMVIAVFLGERYTGGYAIEITKITEGENALVTFVKETYPRPGSPVTMALTQPYHIIEIQKRDEKVFFRHEKPESRASEDGAFPDIVVLKNGRRIRCEIISVTRDSVRVLRQEGKAEIHRSQIEHLIHAAPDEKEGILSLSKEEDSANNPPGTHAPAEPGENYRKRTYRVSIGWRRLTFYQGNIRLRPDYYRILKGPDAIRSYSSKTARGLEGVSIVEDILLGVWGYGDQTLDIPTSYVFMECYEFFGDGKVKHWIAETRLVDRDNLKYETELSQEFEGRWEQTGERSFMIHMFIPRNE